VRACTGACRAVRVPCRAGYLRHYPRFWLKPPLGHGSHSNMSGIPQQPLLAVSCHQPTSGKSLGRCRLDRLKQVFAHPSHDLSGLEWT
jgi:hypothetical protein